MQERQRRSRSLWHAHRVNKHCPELLSLGLSGSAQPCLCWYPGAHVALAALVAPGTSSPMSPVPLGWACRHRAPRSCSSLLAYWSPEASGTPLRGALCRWGVAGTRVVGLIRKKLSQVVRGTDRPAQEHAAGSQRTRSQTAPGGCRGNLLSCVQGAEQGT